MQPRGEISVLSTATRTLVTLGGEIDIDLTAELVGACDAALRMGLPVDFDVRDVTHMDSSAIAMIARVAYASTTPPRLIRPPEVVEFLLEITGIGEVVEVTHADPDLPGPDLVDPVLTGQDAPAPLEPARS